MEMATPYTAHLHTFHDPKCMKFAKTGDSTLLKVSTRQIETLPFCNTRCTLETGEGSTTVTICTTVRFSIHAPVAASRSGKPFESEEIDRQR